MQRKLSLVLAMLMILSAVYVPTAMAAEVSAISITENQCYYIGEDREAEALKVSGELADGTSVNRVLHTKVPMISYSDLRAISCSQPEKTERQ